MNETKRPARRMRRIRIMKTFRCMAIAALILAVLISCAKEKSRERCGEYRAVMKTAAFTLKHRGILESADSVPVFVLTKGRVLSIAEQGTRIRKGGLIARIDDSEARRKRKEYKNKVDKGQMDLDVLERKYELAAFENQRRIEAEKAELSHAALEQRIELARPDENQRRRLEIKKEIAELDLMDHQDEYEYQKRLYDNRFVSRPVLDAARRNLENARDELEEIELTIALENKGITRERRIELEQTVRRRRSVVLRSKQRIERRLSEIRKEIESVKRRLEENRHHLNRFQHQADMAEIRSPRDGIVKINRYFDWKGGGRYQEYKAGDEMSFRDVIANVINPEVMNIRHTVHEADIRFLETGMPVTINMPAFPGKTFSGTLDRLGAVGLDRNLIDPAAESGGSSGVTVYNAVIGFDGQGVQFQPGMSALAEIQVRPPSLVLTVPREGVYGVAGDYYVLRRGEGRPERVEIAGAPLNEHDFRIQSGIDENDVILLHCNGREAR